MRAIRVIACAILAASFASDAPTAANAQSPSDAQTPANFPPASFEGKQFVDSRGCIYIRAGIDGNVTWVPRVTRSRKAICGYKPTFPTGTATAAAPAPTPAATPTTPARITPTPPVVAKPAPKPVTAAKPAPVRVVVAVKPAKPAAVATTAPGAVAAPRTPSPAPAATVFSTKSASYMVPVGPNRIVPRHVFENRQNTLVTAIPAGYRPAWNDGRLNPHRAEHSAAPDAPAAGFVLPKGYRPAWKDGRLNPNRGNRIAAGDARTDQIWERTLPRRLRHVPFDDTRAQLAPTAPTYARSPSRVSRTAWNGR